MAEKIVIAELDINTEGFLKAAQNTKAVINSLKKENQLLKKSGKESSAQFVKNEVAIKRLTTQYAEQKNVLVSLNSENTNFVETSKALNTAVNKNVVSIQGARKNNKELLAVRNQLNLKTKEGQRALTNINKKLDENNKFIKDNSDAYSKQKLNIGNYQSALSGLNPTLTRNLGLLLQVKGGLQAKAAAIRGSTTATNAGTKSLKLFRLALISTGIGAIVVALGSLIGAFASTQKGIDAINKVLAPLKGAFQGIIGVIQDISLNVFGQLKDRWTVASNAILIGIDLIRIGWNKITGDVEEANEIQDRMTKRIEESREAQERLNEKSEALRNIFKGAGDQIQRAVEAQKEIERLTIAIETKEANLILIRAKANDELKKLQLIANDRSISAQENNRAANEAIEIARGLASEEKKVISLKIRQEELRQSQNDSDRKDLKKLNELKAESIAADQQASATELKFLTAKSTLAKQQQAEAKKARTEAEKEKIKQAEADVELAVSLADRELEIFKRNHQRKLEANTFFTEQLLAQELIRLDAIAKAEKDHQTVLLEQGKISKLEFNQAIEDIDFENRERKTEAELLREDALNEKKAIDLENKRLTEQQEFENRFEQQTAQLERSRLKEVQNAIKTGADIQLINDKFAVRQKQLNEASAESKVNANANAFGQIAGFLGRETTAGKAAALAQASINIQQGITKALATKGFAGIVEGALIAAKGAVSVGKIISTPTQFFEGGKIPELGAGEITTAQNIPTQSGGDNILATVKSGEVILNQDQQDRAGGAQFFKSIGVPGFQTGGVTGINTNNSVNQLANSINLDSFADVITDKINSVKIVAIEQEITGEQQQQVEIVNGANI